MRGLLRLQELWMFLLAVRGRRRERLSHHLVPRVLPHNDLRQLLDFYPVVFPRHELLPRAVVLALVRGDGSPRLEEHKLAEADQDNPEAHHDRRAHGDPRGRLRGLHHEEVVEDECDLSQGPVHRDEGDEALPLELHDVPEGHRRHPDHPPVHAVLRMLRPRQPACCDELHEPGSPEAEGEGCGWRRRLPLMREDRDGEAADEDGDVDDAGAEDGKPGGSEVDHYLLACCRLSDRNLQTGRRVEAPAAGSGSRRPRPGRPCAESVAVGRDIRRVVDSHRSLVELRQSLRRDPAAVQQKRQVGDEVARASRRVDEMKRHRASCELVVAENLLETPVGVEEVVEEVDACKADYASDPGLMDREEDRVVREEDTRGICSRHEEVAGEAGALLHDGLEAGLRHERRLLSLPEAFMPQESLHLPLPTPHHPNFLKLLLSSPHSSAPQTAYNPFSHMSRRFAQEVQRFGVALEVSDAAELDVSLVLLLVRELQEGFQRQLELADVPRQISLPRLRVLDPHVHADIAVSRGQPSVVLQVQPVLDPHDLQVWVLLEGLEGCEHVLQMVEGDSFPDDVDQSAHVGVVGPRQLLQGFAHVLELRPLHPPVHLRQLAHFLPQHIASPPCPAMAQRLRGPGLAEEVASASESQLLHFPPKHLLDAHCLSVQLVETHDALAGDVELGDQGGEHWAVSLPQEEAARRRPAQLGEISVGSNAQGLRGHISASGWKVPLQLIGCSVAPHAHTLQALGPCRHHRLLPERLRGVDALGHHPHRLAELFKQHETAPHAPKQFDVTGNDHPSLPSDPLAHEDEEQDSREDDDGDDGPTCRCSKSEP
eukprot:767174-Hanusia_phi.AAC.5